jgi:hypothetical protein
LTITDPRESMSFSLSEVNARIMKQDAEAIQKDTDRIAALRRGVAEIRASGEGPALVAELREDGGLKSGGPPVHYHPALFTYWLQEDPVEAMKHFHGGGNENEFLLFAEECNLTEASQLQGITGHAARDLIIALVRRRGPELSAHFSEMATFLVSIGYDDLETARGRLAFELQQHGTLHDASAIVAQAGPGWQKREMDRFAVNMAKKLPQRKRLTFLEEVHANGMTEDKYSPALRALAESYQDAVWLPLGERIAKAHAVMKEEAHFAGRQQMGKDRVIRNLRSDAVDAEFQQLAKNSIEDNDFAEGQRTAEDVLAIWRDRERDLNDLSEEEQRSRLFVRLAKEDAIRATELLDHNVSPEVREQALAEAAENLVREDEIAKAFDLLQANPLTDKDLAYERRSFAKTTIVHLDWSISPVLVKDFLATRNPSLERDYLAARYATWLKRQGGDISLILDFEEMVQSEEARQAYEQGNFMHL